MAKIKQPKTAAIPNMAFCSVLTLAKCCLVPIIYTFLLFVVSISLLDDTPVGVGRSYAHNNANSSSQTEKRTRRKEHLWKQLRHIQALGRHAKTLHATGDDAAITAMRSALKETRLLFATIRKENSEYARYIAWLASLSLSDVAVDIGEQSLKTNNVAGAKLSSEILSHIDSALKGPENKLLRWVMKINSDEQSRFPSKWAKLRSKQMDWSLIKTAWNEAKNANEQSLIVARMWLDAAQDTHRANQWTNIPYRLFLALTEKKVYRLAKRKKLVISGKPKRANIHQTSLIDDDLDDEPLGKKIANDNLVGATTIDDIHVTSPNALGSQYHDNGDSDGSSVETLSNLQPQSSKGSPATLVSVDADEVDINRIQSGDQMEKPPRLDEFVDEFDKFSKRTAKKIRESAADISEAFSEANRSTVSKMPGPMKRAAMAGK